MTPEKSQSPTTSSHDDTNFVRSPRERTSTRKAGEKEKEEETGKKGKQKQCLTQHSPLAFPTPRVSTKTHELFPTFTTEPLHSIPLTLNTRGENSQPARINATHHSWSKCFGIYKGFAPRACLPWAKHHRQTRNAIFPNTHRIRDQSTETSITATWPQRLDISD